MNEPQPPRPPDQDVPDSPFETGMRAASTAASRARGPAFLDAPSPDQFLALPLE